MKIHIVRGDDENVGTDPHLLNMEAEDDRDRRLLTALVDGFNVCGFGRDLQSKQVLHAQLKLSRDDEDED